MDDQLWTIIGYIKELVVPIFVFAALFGYTIVRGGRALTSLLMSLYLALLISLKFPYYDWVLANVQFLPDHVIRIGLFALFAAFGTMLFEKLLSRTLEESFFEGISRKMLLAVLATVLVMAYSYHVLPVTSFVEPGAKIAMLFGPEEYFFWWLLMPLGALLFLF